MLFISSTDRHKNPPPPPPYSEFDRFEKYNEKGHRGRGRRYDYDDRSDRYSDHSDRYEREEPRRNPWRERPRDRYGDAAKNSYVPTDDDHPQEKFVEKIIHPRVGSRSKAVVKKSTATQDDDDPYDSIRDTKRPSDSESEGEKSDPGTQVEEISDSEENPETESEEESSEEETESEEEKNSRKALYAQPNKAKKKPSSKPDKAKSTQPKQAAPQQPPVLPFTNPGGVGAIPGAPGVARFPFQPVYPAVGFPVRGPIKPMIQPGQFPPGVVRPVFTGPNQFQPVASNLNQFPPAGQFQPVRYQHPPRSAGLIQPGQGQYTQQGQGHPSQPHYISPDSRQTDINVDNPPVFSYLVQRGYKPVDVDHHSQVSSATNHSHRSDLRMEDSDQGHNLGSGVDFMKRTTNV